VDGTVSWMSFIPNTRRLRWLARKRWVGNFVILERLQIFLKNKLELGIYLHSLRSILGDLILAIMVIEGRRLLIIDH
jgi:hypothetical protein